MAPVLRLEPLAETRKDSFFRAESGPVFAEYCLTVTANFKTIRLDFGKRVCDRRRLAKGGTSDLFTIDRRFYLLIAL